MMGLNHLSEWTRKVLGELSWVLNPENITQINRTKGQKEWGRQGEAGALRELKIESRQIFIIDCNFSMIL